MTGDDARYGPRPRKASQGRDRDRHVRALVHCDDAHPRDVAQLSGYFGWFVAAVLCLSFVVWCIAALVVALERRTSAPSCPMSDETKSQIIELVAKAVTECPGFARHIRGEGKR
jgi:hypothetical protein